MAEIVKITFKMGDKEVELSIKEVEELRDMLNQKFPKPTIWVYPSSSSTNIPQASWTIGGGG